MEVPVQEEGRAKMGGVAEVIGGTGFSSQPTVVEVIEVNVDTIDLVNVYCTLYSTSAYWLLANIVK